MATINHLTHYEVNGLPGSGFPTTFDLTAFIPGGAMDASDVQYSFNAVDWAAVTAWNNTTKVATKSPAGAGTIYFRRNTERFAVDLDPTDVGVRVSASALRANANQGLFVAIEMAARFGVDAYSTDVRTDGTNDLALKQLCQNHYGSDLWDMGRKEWPFQFSGGYIDRAHVRAKALVGPAWVPLTISLTDAAAPFRFIGDYQLYLDLSTLASLPTKLIIYRHTPRSGPVEYLADGAVITAPGMEPSARHAFFVAVEIGEELMGFSYTCPCQEPVEESES